MWHDCFLSTTGDLFESKIKRIHKIKDSGSIIPGHGGIFDRVDGVLFVLPFCRFCHIFMARNALFSWKGYHVFT
ncbi:MAG: phosphatidate cytidylyltransferase [Holosporaceae bacterium]|nr:MAG: phosphatidate cytidylyltransferase [Holosporaceae bacterium]